MGTQISPENTVLISLSPFQTEVTWKKRHRGYYMSVHVLLNLSNELRKRDKMQGLLRILSLFRNKFNKFNITGA